MFGVYLAGLVALFATGNFAFVPKEMLLPALVAPPLLLGELRRFAHHWVLFLALVVFFDALRGLVFALISAFDLPVYMGYAIDADAALLGGQTLPELLQQRFLGAELGLVEHVLVAVHASHFVVFLLFAMLIWYWRPRDLLIFARAFVILLFAGLLGYLAVPTVPPWMAAGSFEVLPDVRHVTAEVYHTTLPAFARGFDTNPIAAMPSMHTAIPVLMSLLGARLFGWRALPMIVYTLAVIASITYFGEHYLVDVFAGAALAGLVYLAVTRWLPLAVRDPEPRMDLRRTLLCAGLVLALTVAAGHARAELGSGWIPSRAFVERELAGRSPVAHYYRGFYAHEDGEHARAVAELDALPARLVDRHAARMRAHSLAALGRLDEALDGLARFARAHPDDPAPLYWAGHLGFVHGRIDARQLAQVSARLRSAYADPEAAHLADELDALAAR